MLRWVNLQQITPTIDDTLQGWWQQARGVIAGKKKRKKLNSLVILITWSIWRERNSRIFYKVSKPMNILQEQIKGEAKQWAAASSDRLVLEEG
jgi:hypothetical protein